VSEFTRGPERPVRIAQQFAREQYAVSLAARDNVVRLPRRRDQADRARQDARLTPNALGERNLVSSLDGNRRAGNVSAGRAIDEIHAAIPQQAGQCDRLIQIPSTGRPVSGRNPHEHRTSLRPHATHGIHDLQAEADAILKRSAVPIGSRVAEGGQKFVNEISMRSVDFDHVEAGRKGAPGRGGKRRGNARDVTGRKRRRPGVHVGERLPCRADDRPSARRRRHRSQGSVPWHRRAPLSSGVRKLNGRGTLRSHERR
jgi:hypothetical protein